MSDEWVETTLGEIAQITGGGTPSTKLPEFWGGDVVWLTPTEVVAADGQVISDSARTITTEGLDRSSAKLLPKGTVLLTSRASVGFVAIAGRELATNQGFQSLVPTGSVLSGFLMCWIQANREEFTRRASGSTFPEVSGKKVATIPITLPPLAVQRRIVDLMAHLDNHLANLRAERDAAEQLLVSQRDECLAVKDGWGTSLLSDVTTKIGSGATPRGGASAYIEAGISLIRSQNVRDLRFDWEGLAHISGEQASRLDGVTVESNDLLLNITGASVNRLCMVPDEVLPARVNQHVAIIRVKPDLVSPHFLAHLLRRSDIKARLAAISDGGTTREAITKAQIENFMIEIPTLDVQVDLADVLDAQVELLEALSRELRRVEDLRSAVLNVALSGSLHVPDSYDSLLVEVA